MLSDSLWLNDQSFVWTASLTAPLYTVTVEMQNSECQIVLKPVFNKAGYCRLTHKCSDLTIGPEYVSYSGNSALLTLLTGQSGCFKI